MFRRGNPFVRAREETSSTHRVSHLRAGLSLSWPSHIHIQPNLLKSCHLCIQWKDGTTSWERLADIKESNPIEVAEYAVAQGIDHEPAFAWWVPHTLKKRNRMMAAVKHAIPQGNSQIWIGESRRMLPNARQSTRKTGTRCGWTQ